MYILTSTILEYVGKLWPINMAVLMPFLEVPIVILMVFTWMVHGTSRQHILTFAAALDEVGSTESGNTCPCVQGSIAIPPYYVGEDYFCEEGSNHYCEPSTFYGNDPLWDGKGCDSRHSTCCLFNTPPWFY